MNDHWCNDCRKASSSEVVCIEDDLFLCTYCLKNRIKQHEKTKRSLAVILGWDKSLACLSILAWDDLLKGVQDKVKDSDNLRIARKILRF